MGCILHHTMAADIVYYLPTQKRKKQKTKERNNSIETYFEFKRNELDL